MRLKSLEQRSMVQRSIVQRSIEHRSMVKTMCGARLIRRKTYKKLMQMLGVNESMHYLAVTNNVHYRQA